MFDGKNAKKIEYLEDERKKIWERITALEKQMAEKPSDIEKEARQASKKAAEYRNRAEDRLNEANEIISSLSQIQQDISQKHEDVVTKHAATNETSEHLTNQGEELSSVLKILNDYLENHPDLDDELTSLENFVASVEENASKANTTYKGILTKKAEIDELHREIIGYEDENTDGEITEVEGLKAELESAYVTLIEKGEFLENSISKLDELSKNQYNTFINSHKEELSTLKVEAKKEYDSINQKIESLLPNALTAGLSSAFITKKGEEEELHREYKRSFNRGILYLSIAAFLPIGISIYFLSTGTPLTEVIERSPKVIFAFLPLYVPLVWITISANKKVNLSKRLIEEYSHKQVLSMTIEGLSKQIENIDNNDLSEELRIKLIRNFLEVTNENPGKLISNYQKSDNPILNILDRDKREKSATTVVKTIQEKTESITEKAEFDQEKDEAEK